MKKAHIEVRIANYECNLRELIRRYSENFVLIPGGRPDVEKYAMIQDDNGKEYTVMLSYNHGKYPGMTYNIIMTVIGKNEINAKEIMKTLEEKLEITTQPAPFLIPQFKNILDSFGL